MDHRGARLTHLVTVLVLLAGCRSQVAGQDSAPATDTDPPAPVDTATDTATGPTFSDFTSFPGQGSWSLWEAGQGVRVEKVAETVSGDHTLHWLDVLGNDGSWVAGGVWSVDDEGVWLHASQASGEAIAWHETPQLVVDELVAEPCDTYYAEGWSCVSGTVDEGALAGTWWFAEGEGLAAWAPTKGEPMLLQTRSVQERTWSQGGSVSAAGELVFEKVQSGVPTSLPLVLENTGDGDLELWAADYTYNGADLFSLSGFDAVTLAPGETLELSVGVYFGGLAISNAHLRILSSDPETPDTRVDVELVSSWM